MAQRGSGPIFPIGFDEDALEADLARLGEGGARALDEARVEIERLGGLQASRLMACQAEGRDGTRLPDCVKTYIPWPDGRFGVVFVAVSHPKRPLGCARSPSGCATSRADRTQRASTRLPIGG